MKTDIESIVVLVTVSRSRLVSQNCVNFAKREGTESDLLPRIIAAKWRTQMERDRRATAANFADSSCQ